MRRMPMSICSSGGVTVSTLSPRNSEIKSAMLILYPRSETIAARFGDTFATQGKPRGSDLEDMDMNFSVHGGDVSHFRGVSLSSRMER